MKNFKNRSIAFTFFFIILILGSLMVYRNLNKSKSKLPANVLLTFVSDKLKLAPGQDLTITITLDSQGQEVAAADLVVQYDPKYLKVENVSTGSFFENYPINTTSADYVKISGVASFNGETLILPKGKDTVGQITFKALNKKGKAVINFNKSKTIVASQGQNILDQGKLTNIFIEII